MGSVLPLLLTCHVTRGGRLIFSGPEVICPCHAGDRGAEVSLKGAVSLQSRALHQQATSPSAWLLPVAYPDISCSLQIIGRGNDQVAISSKFETREDIGMLLMGQLDGFLGRVYWGVSGCGNK